jgi:hypothetical protein
VHASWAVFRSIIAEMIGARSDEAVIGRDLFLELLPKRRVGINYWSKSLCRMPMGAMWARIL